jgi:hypothetical protein
MTARPSPSMEAVLARMLAEDGALPDTTTLSPSDGRAQTERVHSRWRRAMPPVALVEDFLARNAAGGMMRCRRILPHDTSPSGAICQSASNRDPLSA